MAQTQTKPEGWTRKSLRSISALLLREMATTYGRSPGGYLWAVVEPSAGIALLTFVFSLAFRSPPLGDNFPIFYATGILPFMMYVQMNSKLMVSIWFSKPLLQYPAVSFIDAIISRLLLNLMTQIMVFYVVITTIMILYKPQVTIDAPTVALSISMATVLGSGVGVLNCLLISVAPVWQRAWNILNRPMFIISGIFFLFESIPEPYASILWFNPLVHIIGVMRSAFYPTYDANYVSVAYVFGFGLISMVVGLFFLRRWHKDFLYS
ncbi:sugar ABC transporter permease [Aliishimia ponticola]|uniref:Transport permease protein n=1 Tax=Aliishimia ponticola TaxID=2499833 RepID=A0A4S4NHA9_9RHOB|nr:ABC transporter permease [Aliishimia ponticola]THH38047.1 sugar ABC transporter permease [Aliishimia ponticola]